jgi:crotonobetainyl-CoA:carnitine CoA-transferase CaiB-like acyl-CoA transferase
VDGKATRIAPSPMLGEHTEQVISDWLGLNDAAIATLKQDGALG